ncbi:beta-ketoacyl-[acyl-carrier-protein] synthase family protein [Streptomyces sp. NPDC023327]|uniref:beta-ketoacyl-[acyl-carrier-protein] synthase family protein n=1 Tax=Streptomyces sp. NPDC023327 TaxID=3157088 RepID=UPI0033C64A64
MTLDPIAVTGIGLVTPAGVGTAASWRNLRAGRSMAATDPELAGLAVDIACRVPRFDTALAAATAEERNLDRCTQFALVAAREAVQDAGHDTTAWPSERVAVVLGSATGGTRTWEEQCERFVTTGVRGVTAAFLPKFLPNMLAGQLSRLLNARGPSLHTSTACASGATAIGIAVSLLRSRACDIAVVGGAEAAVTPMVVSAFTRLRALSRRTADPAGASRPFDKDRSGFVIAEGAGILVLERADYARRRRHPGYAHIVGYGSSSDAHHPVAPHPQGTGARQAIGAALADAGANRGEVDHVNAHGTGTKLNDAVEGKVLEDLFEQRPSVTANKGVLGHMLGGAGAVEAAFTALSIAHRVIPVCTNLDTQDPALFLDTVRTAERVQDIRLALSNSFGFGGHNCVLALRPTG